MKNYVALAVLTLIVSACGGGSSSSSDTSSSIGGGSTANVFADAFTSLVFNLTGTASESAEPVAIDAIATTAPEDTEPTPII